jgi:hypothetical protein
MQKIRKKNTQRIRKIRKEIRKISKEIRKEIRKEICNEIRRIRKKYAVFPSYPYFCKNMQNTQKNTQNTQYRGIKKYTEYAFPTLLMHASLSTSLSIYLYKWTPIQSTTFGRVTQYMSIYLLQYEIFR